MDAGIIGAQTVVDAARTMRSRGDELDSDVIESLANTPHGDLPQVANTLAAVGPGDRDADTVQRKWLWLLLLWLYETGHDDSAVFDKIDSVYADFGYPPEMTTFGPYAPAYQIKDDPIPQRKRVLKEWREYLDRAGAEFGTRGA